MLYLLYQHLSGLGDHIPFLNLLKYLTFRSGMAMVTAYIVAVAMGSRFIRWMRPSRARASRSAPTASSATSLEKAGTPDHGRLHDPGRPAGRHPAVGRPDQRPRLDGDAGHRLLWRAGLPRRLRQGHQADERRPLQRPEAGRAVRRGHRRRGDADRLRAQVADDAGLETSVVFPLFKQFVW
jgi:hypothetical protein